MNKLTYSRRNDTYNGKVQFDTLTVWGWYSKDGHAYLNSDDGLLLKIFKKTLDYWCPIVYTIVNKGEIHLMRTVPVDILAIGRLWKSCAELIVNLGGKNNEERSIEERFRTGCYRQQRG